MEEKERLMKELETQRDIHLKAVERTQNEDRKRIAGNLHDSVGAMLSSIKMRLNSLQSDFQNHIPDKADKFAATVGLIDETVQELRRIVYDMMPLSLHRFGLPPALNAFVDQINESQRVQVELQILGLDERLIEELEMTIYRICQELVQNVLKHAAATKLRIQIIRHLDRVNLIVEDNGIGMTTSSVVPGIGFDTITAKVDLYRGTFTIESSPGKGTMILIDIPLMNDTHE
jgi:signal transduction histidine kinase